MKSALIEPGYSDDIPVINGHGILPGSPRMVCLLRVRATALPDQCVRVSRLALPAGTGQTGYKKRRVLRRAARAKHEPTAQYEKNNATFCRRSKRFHTISKGHVIGPAH